MGQVVDVYISSVLVLWFFCLLALMVFGVAANRQSEVVDTIPIWFAGAFFWPVIAFVAVILGTTGLWGVLLDGIDDVSDFIFPLREQDGQ